jgi:dual specificity tyrosine-phosphorylation-regulated kinase 2/3/4
MDVFSFACVVAELLAGRPLFPGDSESRQLQLHMEMMGPPPSEMVARARRRGIFFRQDGSPKAPIGAARRSLAAAAGTGDARLLDLLAKCFVWDQTQRITAEEALAHPFFAGEAAVVEAPRRAPSPAKGVKASASVDAHMQLKKRGVERVISPRRSRPWR